MREPLSRARRIDELVEKNYHYKDRSHFIEVFVREFKEKSEKAKFLKSGYDILSTSEVGYAMQDLDEVAKDCGI